MIDARNKAVIFPKYMLYLMDNGYTVIVTGNKMADTLAARFILDAAFGCDNADVVLYDPKTSDIECLTINDEKADLIISDKATVTYHQAKGHNKMRCRAIISWLTRFSSASLSISKQE